MKNKKRKVRGTDRTKAIMSTAAEKRERTADVCFQKFTAGGKLALKAQEAERKWRAEMGLDTSLTRIKSYHRR